VFLQERDRLCHNGKLLWSPAFSQHNLEQQEEETEAGAAIQTVDNGEHDIESV